MGAHNHPWSHYYQYHQESSSRVVKETFLPPAMLMSDHPFSIFWWWRTTVLLANYQYLCFLLCQSNIIFRHFVGCFGTPIHILAVNSRIFFRLHSSNNSVIRPRTRPISCHLFTIPFCSYYSSAVPCDDIIVGNWFVSSMGNSTNNNKRRVGAKANNELLIASS